MEEAQVPEERQAPFSLADLSLSPKSISSGFGIQAVDLNPNLSLLICETVTITPTSQRDSVGLTGGICSVLKNSTAPVTALNTRSFPSPARCRLAWPSSLEAVRQSLKS